MTAPETHLAPATTSTITTSAVAGGSGRGRIWTIRALPESSGPPRPEPCVAVVRNDEDGQLARQHLKRFGEYATRAMPGPQVLVRPTPGAVDQATFGLDTLVALGKNPEVLASERLASHAWAHARAWLAAVSVTDLVVDRAHQLGADRVGELAELAGELGCRVWLIWSGGGDLEAVTAAVRSAGVDRASIIPQHLPTLLRPPAPAPPPDFQPSEAILAGGLSRVEFTTFRAAARRHLAPREFDKVDQLYQHAAGQTDNWLADHHHLCQAEPDTSSDASGGLSGDMFGGALAAWLRDTQLGPRHDPDQALTVLRATQAALFVAGVLLRWDPAALGPDPAGRLPGTLDPRHRRHPLYAGARTTPAAVTMLSLHLNQPPLHFNCWRLGDADPDGSLLRPPGPHPHTAPAYLSYPDYRAAIERSSRVYETACAHPVRVPGPGRVLLAAHHAWRRQHGAGASDPLFADPRNPDRPADYYGLREQATRTAGRLHRTPAWLHRDNCRYGGDIGLHPRATGWLIERGLSVHLLSQHLADRVPHPIRRPPWK